MGHYFLRGSADPMGKGAAAKIFSSRPGFSEAGENQQNSFDVSYTFLLSLGDVCRPSKGHGIRTRTYPKCQSHIRAQRYPPQGTCAKDGRGKPDKPYTYSVSMAESPCVTAGSTLYA